MGDKSANIDSTYVENSLSFPVIADKTNEDSSSSDDDGGSNDSALQRSSVPFISAENNSTCTIANSFS